jgi:hypothetical protein
MRAMGCGRWNVAVRRILEGAILAGAILEGAGEIA